MSDMLRLVNSSEVRIEGLETLDYLDNLSHKERFTEQGDAITFESEVKNFPVLNELNVHIYYLNMLKLASDLHLGKSFIFIGIDIHITICLLLWIVKHNCRRFCALVVVSTVIILS